MIDLFKKKKETDREPAVYRFDERVPVRAYAWTIAEKLIYSEMRKKYTAPKEKDALVKPKNAHEAEVQAQKPYLTTLKKTIHADPTQANSGFLNVSAAADSETQNFENQNLFSVLLPKLAKEKQEYETLIRLRFYKEMSYREIAESGLSEYTTEESCKSHASRAMRILRELARQEGLFKHLDKNAQ